MIDPVSALATYMLKWLLAGRLRAFVRLVMSLVVSSTATFCGTMGISLWALQTQYPLGLVWTLSAGNALIATAGVIVWIVRRSPDAKGLMLAVPGDVEREFEKLLQEHNIVTSGQMQWSSGAGSNS
jgi:hypothetical protein